MKKLELEFMRLDLREDGVEYRTHYGSDGWIHKEEIPVLIEFLKRMI